MIPRGGRPELCLAFLASASLRPHSVPGVIYKPELYLWENDTLFCDFFFFVRISLKIVPSLPLGCSVTGRKRVIMKDAGVM